MHIFGSVPLLPVATIVATGSRGPILYEPMFGSQRNHFVCFCSASLTRPSCSHSHYDSLVTVPVSLRVEGSVLPLLRARAVWCGGADEPMFGFQRNQPFASAPGIADCDSSCSVWWRFKQARLERGGMMQQGLQCGGGSGGERRFDAARQPFVHLYRCRSAAF